MNQSTYLADSFVSLAALVGTLVLLSVIKRQGTSDPLNKRFIFGLRVIVTLLIGRILFWTTGYSIFNIPTTMAAGAIPLAVLLLTEGLLRRHAPFALKMGVGILTILFAIVAFVPSTLAQPYLSWALLLYQLGVFVAVGWLVISRDRSDLSATENQLVDRIALSLLIIIPVLATDFRLGIVDTPVRLGGLGILFMCWLAVGLGRTQMSHRDTLLSFLVIALAATLGGLAIAGTLDLGPAGTIKVIALALSATLAASIYNDSVSLQAEERRDTLIRHIAEGNINTSEDFLRGLQDHVLVEDALILNEPELGDFDLERVKTVFMEKPVRRLEDLDNSGLSETSREQLAWFFEKYEATHILLASLEPLKIVALKMPKLSSSPSAELEIQVAQRMAMLVSRQGNVI